MAQAPRRSEIRTALSATPSETGPSLPPASGSITFWRSNNGSADSMMRLIMLTDPTGYFPTAVSPESITASVPSKTALATSLASARVGEGLVIMDSSICVAVITGVLHRAASAMILFCSTGTFHGDSSTPRSPRATMTASAASRIASRSPSACGFSILAMSLARPFSLSMMCLASRMSLARRTNDSAI